MGLYLNCFVLYDFLAKFEALLSKKIMGLKSCWYIIAQKGNADLIPFLLDYNHIIYIIYIIHFWNHFKCFDITLNIWLSREHIYITHGFKKRRHKKILPISNLNQIWWLTVNSEDHFLQKPFRTRAQFVHKHMCNFSNDQLLHKRPH